MLLPYREHTPTHGEASEIAGDAALIGRARAGSRLVLRSLATLRADGESITIGENVFFDERATVHIADGLIPSSVGNDVTVGRYALVHACTLEDGVVIGDAAAVMDGARVGAYAVIAAGTLVPPRKDLPGGHLYAGNPASPVRSITREETRQWAAELRGGRSQHPVQGSGLPALVLSEVERALASGAKPTVDHAYVAPTAVVVGDVMVHRDAGIFFGCIVAAGDGRIEIGPGTNIQDNSILITHRARGDLVIGSGVTVGHNARVGSADIGDDALIGMGCELEDNVMVRPGGCVGARSYVERGTVVESNWIWAGRPARAFREVKASEREAFGRFRDIYVGYSSAYRGL
ncbi:MAG: gamma carbonic anhydrase family protein [Pseudomonadota bacterium]|nr:gamma carbonic anhydrase family protein [Pseudomonadota bacterium]